MPQDPPPGCIWFVNQYAGSPWHGMEFRHYELGRQLASLGHSVVIISGSYSHLFTHQPAVKGTYTVENLDGLTYCWVRVPRYGRSMSIGRVLNMAAFMIRLYRLPKNRLPAPDVVVVSSPSLFPILPMEGLARRRHAGLVFEVRDLWPLTLQELGGLSRRHPLVVLMRWFEDRAYRAADTVVTVLPNAVAYLQARGVARARIAIIPNGVDSDTLREPAIAAPVPVRSAVAGASFVLGFVGTLGTANALDTLIGAARLLAEDDIRVVIVGNGPERARLHDLAHDLPNVAFVGPVAKAEVAATLRQFDACYVGFHRSRLYRFGISPNKVFDYMAAGRPIILAADAANDLVREARCGSTVPPDDPVALAAAIRTLRSMTPNERADLGANGRQYVSREHTYASLAARYERVLRGSRR